MAKHFGSFLRSFWSSKSLSCASNKRIIACRSDSNVLANVTQATLRACMSPSASVDPAARLQSCVTKTIAAIADYLGIANTMKSSRIRESERACHVVEFVTHFRTLLRRSLSSDEACADPCS